MTLLDFARGPALEWSVVIFLVGAFWRIVGAVLMVRHKYLSVPRSTATFSAGIRTILTRSWPAHELEKHIRFQHYTGYIFHITLFIVILFYVPHIAFFQDVVGFSWPGLPSNVVMVAGSLTVAVLIALLIRRLSHPVLRMISNADDYISWLVTITPVVTGMMAYAHMGPRYETMLGIHILTVELLLIWFPFGKLMHAFFIFPCRAQIGAKFERRGVRA